MLLREDVTLGLDIGIGSVGWVLLEKNPDRHAKLFSRVLASGEVVEAAGVRLVDVPEDPKTKELLSKHRRDVRRQRLTIQRRAQRMRAVRKLVAENVYARANDVNHMHHDGQAQISPWQLRVAALERKLTDKEFALILVHMAKHRGFLSNSKKDKVDSASDSGKMLKSIAAMEQQMAESNMPTMGMFLAAQETQRNRSGVDGKPVYTHTAKRLLLVEEAKSIFAVQYRLGNSKATQKLFDDYQVLAFKQRPLKSVEELVGECSFIPGEKRAPRHSLTSEKFRLAQRLCILRLSSPGEPARPFTVNERTAAMSLLGSQKSITYATLRKKLKLPEIYRFEGLSYGNGKAGKAANPEKDDVVARNKACGLAHVIFTEVLGKDAVNVLLEKRAENGQNLMDCISKIISDNDDKEEIAKAFSLLGLTDEIMKNLLAAIDAGKFSDFSGVMSLSVKAMEAILPLMLECGDYAEGCRLAGFDHTQAQAADWHNIKNPVVQHMLREVRRQVESVVHEFGVVPGRVHIEMARDMGKSIDERNAISKGMEENRSRNDRARARLAECFQCEPWQISPTELTRYKLWEQQGGKCCYYMLWRKSGGESAYSAKGAYEGSIDIMQLRDVANATQIDHILPYSRTHDSSFHNLGLCISAANQNKGNRTPYEWVGQENAQSWHEFEQWINSLSASGLKKRNYLLKDLASKQEMFSQRNLNDTRYISRVILDWFTREFYPKYGVQPTYGADGAQKRRVFARPGQLTAFLRKNWGLESIKKDSAGQRIGDKHHALDAFVVACCSESLLQKVTSLFQKLEKTLLSESLPPPMLDCRHQLEQMCERVFPSRVERGKTKGALHEDTLRAMIQEVDKDGKEITALYKRVPITKLIKLADLDKIKDAHRCPDIIRPLRIWIEAGKPQAQLPRSDATGYPIKKVRLREGPFISGIVVKRGKAEAQASNGSMIRTDVFQKEGQYYLVPVYTWQYAQGILPDRAIVSGKPEKEWLVVDETFTFCFSLYPNSYLVVDNGRETKAGYYIGTDRSTSAITLASAHDRNEKNSGIGVRRLKSFKKYRVDRLGRRHEVKKEKRPSS